MSADNYRHVTRAGQPTEMSVVPADWKQRVPSYCDLLEQANGFEFHGGLFRVFGIGHATPTRDALSWNQSAWREAYGVPSTTIIWGENIFGDQLGIEPGRGMLVLSCEGGEVQWLPYGSPSEYLTKVVTNDPRTWLEHDLVLAALERNIRPSVAEHLSFELPLVCGGVAEAGNLEVMDAHMHLDILGQLVEQNRSLPDQARIRAFVS